MPKEKQKRNIWYWVPDVVQLTSNISKNEM